MVFSDAVSQVSCGGPDGLSCWFEPSMHRVRFSQQPQGSVVRLLHKVAPLLNMACFEKQLPTQKSTRNLPDCLELCAWTVSQ